MKLQNELDFLSKIRHPNIISLVGYSVHEDMGFIVYELMQNGSLEDLLHGNTLFSYLFFFSSSFIGNCVSDDGVYCTDIEKSSNPYLLV